MFKQIITSFTGILIDVLKTLYHIFFFKANHLLYITQI